MKINFYYQKRGLIIIINRYCYLEFQGTYFLDSIST